MSTKKLIVCTLVAGLTLGLSGCDHGGQSPSTNAPDKAAGAAQSSLQITKWGPDRTKAGVVFNEQSDGSAALWIRMNRSLSGADVVVDFNGQPLTTAVQGDLVTATVPPSLFAAQGTYALHVSVKQDGAVVQSNGVSFVVE